MNYKYLVLAPLAFIATLSASANELRGDVDVTLTIGEGCAVNGQTSGGVNKFGAVDFGQHSNLNLFIDSESIGAAASSIELTCNTALAYSITLDDGQYANAGQRRVQRGGVDFVSYDLYQDAARTVRWGTGAQAQVFTGTGASQPIVIYGRVIAGQTTPGAGAFTDTVRMLVNW